MALRLKTALQFLAALVSGLFVSCIFIGVGALLGILAWFAVQTLLGRNPFL